MKHRKRIISVLLTLIMALALAVPAFADETYSITINNSAEGHTYEAYQIFTGDLYEGTLSNIVWGSGVSETGQTALGDAAAKAETIKTADDAADFAKELAPYLDTVAGSANAVTDGKYVISGLAAGYYLIKDQDGSLTDDHDSYTSYILKVVKNENVSPKNTGTPEVVKKVRDINDSTGETSGWQDSADLDISDSVPFQLTATLANNVSSYTTYTVVFHDTMSKGLTYNNDAKVYIGGEETDGFTITSTVNADGTTTLTISCDDVKALGAGNSSVITVEYTATLNENAVIGSAGNPNKVYLKYSNNPHDSTETGKTPEDTVIVFTYKTIINKVDGEDKALTGAAFKLEKKLSDNTWKLIKEFTVDEANPTSTFTFTGLDDGTYKLTETVTPASYNTIEPIEFTITASHDIESESPRLTELKVTSTADTERDPEEGEDAGTGKIKVPAFTTNTADGSLSANVINNKGAELPSTGGMGTTIFYVVGSILVLAAVVLLVTKKRMSGEK